MDILSEVLETLRISGSAGFRGELRAPWGISVAPTPACAPFYVVSSGSMYLDAEGLGTPRLVGTGDLIMLPNGGAHAIADQPESPRKPLEELCAAPRRKQPNGDAGPRPVLLRSDGHGTRTEIFTGTFRIDDDPTATILRSLGELIHIRAGDETTPDFGSLLSLSCREIRNPAPGSGFVTAELMKLLFIQVLRSAMAKSHNGDEGCPPHPFALMFHARMSAVAGAIHLHPDRGWKVEDLAALAGMSRTSFSLLFVELTGMPPLTYLTRWRMIKAAQLLRDKRATLAEVASRVGYASETAFSIAFKREMGLAPGRYRVSKSGSAGAMTRPLDPVSAATHGVS